MPPLGALLDDEGDRVPDGLPPIVDAHVHVFPDRLFQAVWSWFEEHAWPIRYPLRAPDVLSFLLSRGVAHVVALPYAHKPGIARGLNSFVAALASKDPRLTGGATVFPGEEGAEEILNEAFDAGLAVVKLHCHVQCVGPDDPRLLPIYALCQERGRPIVMHAGREPKSAAYRCDTHAICSADRIERVLLGFPNLKLCVPHLGADEFEAYRDLQNRFDNLWLDTTMMLAGFFPGVRVTLNGLRPERLMYGTDFPNLPYAWDRELRILLGLGLSDESLERILFRTAAGLFGIARPGPGPRA